MQIHRNWTYTSTRAEMYKCIKDEIPFKQPKPYFGHEIPRETNFLHLNGCAPITYKFGGEKWISEPVPDGAKALFDELRRISFDVSGSWPNVVLVHLYKPRKGSISWHADDEQGMVREDGKVLPITSFSLGASAMFSVRRQKGKPRKTVKMKLNDGDVLVMGTGSQEDWHHSIAKGDIGEGRRMSLTFRTQQNVTKAKSGLNQCK